MIMQDINKVEFSQETVRFIHELIAKAVLRAIKNGTYQPKKQSGS
jgi:hypothetical protein